MENEKLNQTEINPSLFDKLSESDLAFLLEHDKDKLTEEQVLKITAKLQQIDNEELDKDRVYTLAPAKRSKRAGYVDVVILMLVTWVTCLLGMAYIYIQLGIMS